jgi:HpcH/HpaI aldolase/citrate lyase family
MSAAFELLLFAVEPGLVHEAVAAGIDGIVVDWERQGKLERQLGVDTEINEQTVGDLVRVRETASCPVICRLNPCNGASVGELEAALEGGADEILVPMVRSPDEVERMLQLADGRCGVGILVETVQAVAASSALARLPISRAYVGLNDLAIDRGSTSIFDALLDGTVERVRGEFDVPFGFGGLTLPDRGAPIPCRDLIAEMVRLDCSFSFLRRSFRRDVAGQKIGVAIARIREAIEVARVRPDDAIAADRAALVDVVERIRAPREVDGDVVAVA